MQRIRLRPSGLSPRVRGIPTGAAIGGMSARSIPACTGNPATAGACTPQAGVYPRVYGESADCEPLARAFTGLSPRVRGIQNLRAAANRALRSIPACTGNPGDQRLVRSRLEVYPRVYGESSKCLVGRLCRSGLSPRVRGIHRGSKPRRAKSGSIPACTGNPEERKAKAKKRGVYPRVYGESTPGARREQPHRGLSPRVRGIHLAAVIAQAAWRSIPACTGNPRPRYRSQTAIRVYPRVYGESDNLGVDVAEFLGLSPRVRGIHYRAYLDELGERSIPACTGNPNRKPALRPLVGVYPRVYGESPLAKFRHESLSGLSPRVRGILHGRPPPAAVDGSIPACTGNPGRTGKDGRRVAVYPRVYGESSWSVRKRGRGRGLSPRVRGIPPHPLHFLNRSRSIPACTGNPEEVLMSSYNHGVYPRVYGESRSTGCSARRKAGLSPRVRGIPRRPGIAAARSRSIPACTGNPRATAR